MNKNYIIINDIGEVIGSTYVSISQGNNKVDEFYIGYLNYTSADGYVTIAPSLPDNTNLPEMNTSNVSFEYSSFTFNNVVYPARIYNGFKFTLTDALTSQAGTLKLTIRLKNNTTNTTLCSSVVNLTIHASVIPTTPTITDAQYDTISQAINDNYTTLNDNKLDKVFTTHYSSASSIDASNDLVILNQSNTPKYATLSDIYNILSVNNITPVSRNISLDSEDIPHDDTNVGNAIDVLETNVETRAYKYQLDDKVSCRDGTLNPVLPTASEYHGVLPLNITKMSSNKIKIELDGYTYKNGDILVISGMHDSEQYTLINGDFVRVITPLGVGVTDTSYYPCIFVYSGSNSIRYYSMTYEHSGNTITIEFDGNGQMFDLNYSVRILRP